MSSSGKSRSLQALAAVAALALVALAAVTAGRAELTSSSWGLITVAGGGIALLVLGFPPRDLVTALGHGVGRLDPSRDLRPSARVWKAAARNAWVLGAMGATTAFVAHLCWGFTGLDGFVTGLGDVAVSLTSGLGLAALLSLPALRLSRRTDGTTLPTPSSGERDAGFSWRHLPAYGLLALLATWPLAFAAASPRFQPADWILHWPATLVVAGGGLALALYLGFPRNAEALTLGLASAGVVAALLGLTQALRGFANASIEGVTAGLTFMISASFASLVGLAAFGLPGQDRAQGPCGEAPSVASRVAWYGIPFLAVVCLALTTLMVLTPMKKRMPHSDTQDGTIEAPVSRVETPGRLDLG